MAASPLDNFYEYDASRIEGEIYEQQRVTGRVSALIEKQELPDGMGYNFNTVRYERSIQTGGNDWVDVVAENGTVNNCVPTPNTVSPASTLLSYNAQAKLINSNKICVDDVRNAYMYKEQVAAIRDNFMAEIVDTWEDRDKYWYFTYAAHKIVANSTLTEGSASMPATPATTGPNQQILDQIYQRIIMDGGGKQSYAMSDGTPLITAVMSMAAHQSLITQSPEVRQDIRYAEMGEGAKAQLLQSWNIDRAYGGFMHIIDNRMPRYNLVGGVWVEQAFYTTSAATVGTKATVNPSYLSAQYEDCYIFHPKVVLRQMPRPLSSVGSGTTFDAVKWNGDVVWRNILNETENPLGNWGRYWAALKAAYKPAMTNLGYVIRFQRCNNVTLSNCYSTQV